MPVSDLTRPLRIDRVRCDKPLKPGRSSAPCHGAVLRHMVAAHEIDRSTQTHAPSSNIGTVVHPGCRPAPTGAAARQTGCTTAHISPGREAAVGLPPQAAIPAAATTIRSRCLFTEHLPLVQ